MCFFRPNQPCPIFCPLIVQSENNIVNPDVPTSEFAFFSNPAPGTIEADSIIPVTFVSGRGSSISSSETTVGAINLTAGTYEVSYMANAVTPTGENATVSLELNGVEISGSAVTASGTAGTSVVLGQTIIVNVPSTGTLELVNSQDEPTEFHSSSVTINRL